MGRRGKILTRALGAPALGASLLLAGCADRIEFHGKVFEAMGLDNIDRNKTAAKNVPTRAPLVVPPSRNLPPPGAPEQALASADASWPQDPDELARKAAAEQKRKQKEYYEKGDWSGKGGIEEFEKIVKPHQRRPGIMGDLDMKDQYRSEEFRKKAAPQKPDPAAEENWATETQTQQQP